MGQRMSTKTKSPPLLATLTPSPFRRLFATGLQMVLGVFLLFSGFGNGSTTLGLKLFLIGIGIFVILNGMRLYKATSTRLELTRDGLFDGNGRVLARLADIKKVDRGLLAFKPSQGFLVVLNTRTGRAWAPGLWWRFGRQLGVGGVTSPGEGKYMAEQLQFLVAARDDADLAPPDP